MSQEDKKTLLNTIHDAWSSASSSTIEKLFDDDTTIQVDSIDQSYLNSGYTYVSSSPSLTSNQYTITIPSPTLSNGNYINNTWAVNNLWSYDVCLNSKDGEQVYLDNSELQDIYYEWLEYKDIKRKVELYPTVRTLWDQLKVALRVTDNAEKEEDAQDK